MSIKDANLSAWALNNQSLVRYFMLLLFIAGIYSYTHLNQREDPDFTIKVMMIQVAWPGATEAQMEDQVVDKIEQKLLELNGLDYTQTLIKPGMAQIMVSIKDSVRGANVSDSWYQVRKKINDIRDSLPKNIQGPYFNDEFGDTYSNIFAFVGKDYNFEELRQIVENVKREFLRVNGVGKVDLLGLQSEQITVNLSSTKLASLGVGLNQVLNAVQAQNSVAPSGSFNTKNDDIPVRVSGNFSSLEDIKGLPIASNGKIFRLGDTADIRREFIDPPKIMIHHNGSPAILLAVSLDKKADVIASGSLLQKKYKEIQQKLPLGIDQFVVADQPQVVKSSVSEFITSLIEAVIIVLAVSFISLGFRTGIVIAISIPLVLSVTFMLMQVAGIDLQRISLGALIISLGLLVDDAIIAVEMMVLKLEEGYDKFKAATFAYTATAFPMLSGTLITVAGFLPVGLNDSSSGEYVFSLFAVVGISLMVSWVVAVIFTPYLGFHLLKVDKHEASANSHANAFERPFYKKLKILLDWVIDNKRKVVLGSVAIFAFSLLMFKLFVAQQFFPSSDRRELLVDIWLNQASSIYNTESEAARFEKLALAEDGVEYVTTFIGSGIPRFYLPLDVQQPNINYAQVLVMTKSTKDSFKVLSKLTDILEKQFPDVRGRVTRLELGPPVGYPVQFRVSGPDEVELKRIASQVENIMRVNPYTTNINSNWGEDLKSIHLEVNQNKAQQIGVSSSDLSQQLNMLLSGAPMTYYLDREQTIPVIARLDKTERMDIGNLNNLMIQTATNNFVPIGQIAKPVFTPEASTKYRRSRVPTITLKADVAGGVQGNDVTNQIYPKLKELEKNLPLGYHINLGGSLESSQKSQESINAVFPLMILVVITLLMLQLRSFTRVVVVLLTAPLGFIGVTLALILFNAPFGFVALLGVIALIGIIIRNSVILIDQIETDIKNGETKFDAVKLSVVRRFRPIMLTAAAAILAMIPLVRSAFWGPMAVAMMGGLFIATVLTLIFLPALYAWVFKIEKPV